MSLRYALLSLLSGQDMTGYEVSRQFSQSVAHVWHAPDSQIYPELRRLAEEGALEVEEIDDGGRGTKKLYRITEIGMAELRSWLAAPTAHRRQRDPAYLKAAYLEWADADAVRARMHEHIAFYSAHLEKLESTRASLLDRSHPTLRRRLERHPVAQHERIVAWKVFAYDGLIEQARQEIAWARRGLELAAQFDASGEADAPVA
ncbi:PadR family transcriptional regulator [Microbacterium sp. KNMS]